MMGTLLAVPADVPDCGLSGRTGRSDRSCGLCILRTGEVGRGSGFGVDEAAQEIAEE